MALAPNSGPDNKKKRTPDGLNLEKGTGGDGGLGNDENGGSGGTKG